MNISPEKLEALLVQQKYVDKNTFDSAVREAGEKNVPIELFLAGRGLIDDATLGRVLASYYQCEFIDLSKLKIDKSFLEMVPEVMARAQGAIIFDRGKEGLKLATSDPANLEVINFIEKRVGEHLIVYYATPLCIQEKLKYYKGSLQENVRHLIEDIASHPQNEDDVVKLVNYLLEFASDNRASDIHIEPLEGTVSVRFRIDGILHEVSTYPRSVHEKLVSRIKILARLRTDENAAAQDGRFNYTVDGAPVDIRVSIVPIAHGENIVLRLLSQFSHHFFIKDLGFSQNDLEKMERAAAKPYGMILSAGPTGSGKTTTMYALLQKMNRPEVNIMTIEDPIEYQIPHIQQIQVNAKKDLTFPSGLRSIVRQDPDIIMVGEIRDNETADIAVNAAMTGHRVLSTLHANDAATTFPRLFDMGGEPFLIASSVNVVVAQRLVRKICEQCSESATFTKEEIELLRSDIELGRMTKAVLKVKDLSKATVRRGRGTVSEGKTCPICDGTGYKERVGIFEVLEVTDDIRSLITQKASASVIKQKAEALGMTSMLWDGLIKVGEGITTLAEIIRVTKV